LQSCLAFEIDPPITKVTTRPGTGYRVRTSRVLYYKDCITRMTDSVPDEGVSPNGRQAHPIVVVEFENFGRSSLFFFCAREWEAITSGEFFYQILL